MKSVKKALTGTIIPVVSSLEWFDESSTNTQEATETWRLREVGSARSGMWWGAITKLRPGFLPDPNKPYHAAVSIPGDAYKHQFFESKEEAEQYISLNFGHRSLDELLEEVRQLLPIIDDAIMFEYVLTGKMAKEKASIIRACMKEIGAL